MCPSHLSHEEGPAFDTGAREGLTPTVSPCKTDIAITSTTRRAWLQQRKVEISSKYADSRLFPHEIHLLVSPLPFVFPFFAIFATNIYV